MTAVSAAAPVAPQGAPPPPADLTERVAAILADHGDRQGPLLPILHAMQAAFGYVPQAALPQIARALNLSAAEVQGVVSFYHDFRSAPTGRHVIRLCRSEACQALGAKALARQAMAALGVDWHGTSADGAVTLEPVFCLGLCACAPAAQVDGRPLGRLDGASLDALIAGLR